MECYFTLDCKGLPGTNTLANLRPFVSDKENKVL
jgi:hypothetical protein